MSLMRYKTMDASKHSIGPDEDEEKSDLSEDEVIYDEEEQKQEREMIQED